MKGVLLRAEASGIVLEMIYQNEKGEISQRRIMVLTVNEELFKAYCYTRRQQRTFKLSNVLSIGPVRKMKRGA